MDFALLKVALPLARTTRYATGHPVRGRGDYAGSVTSGVVNDPETVEGHACDIVDASGKHYARLLVFPEGAFTASIEGGVIDRWHGRPQADRPTILVPGSVYETETSGLTNHARVLGGDEYGELHGGSVHNKFEPVRHLRERILFPTDAEPLVDNGRRLEIHVLRNGVKLAVVICRDALDEDCQRLLEDLEVDVVAVPSYSTATRNFEAKALDWATNRNMSMVLANSGPVSGAYSVIGRPGLQDGVWVAERRGMRSGTTTTGHVFDDTGPCTVPGIHVVDDDSHGWPEVGV